MQTYARNLSVCLEEDNNQSRSDMVCHSRTEDNIASGLSAFVIIINALHIGILSQIKCRRRSPFFTVLWLSAVLDIIVPLFECVNQICVTRKFVVFSYPILVVCATAIQGSLMMIRAFIATIAICERWLMLAKPFEYSEHLFIRKFDGWICVCAIFFSILNFLTYVILFFADNLICYDSGIGMLYSESLTISYVISTPYISLFICLVLAASFFIAELRKLKTTMPTLAVVDTQTEQACNYVLISTIIYILVTIFAFMVEVFLLAQGPQTVTFGEQLKFWSSQIFQLCGCLDVLTLCATLKLYRKKIRSVLHKLLICRRRERDVNDHVQGTSPKLTHTNSS